MTTKVFNNNYCMNDVCIINYYLFVFSQYFFFCFVLNYNFDQRTIYKYNQLVEFNFNIKIPIICTKQKDKVALIFNLMGALGK